MTTKILSAYDKPTRTVHPIKGKSMTEQHHKKACDINTIMAKYNKTGLVDHVNRYEGTYGDVTGADFKAAQDLIANEKTKFAELPANVRAEFDNDPANYLDLVATDEGIETLKGILNPPEEPDEIVPPKPGFDGETGSESPDGASEAVT